MEKYCSGCQKRKLFVEFSKNAVMRDGLANWCKACLKQHSQKPEIAQKRRERRYSNVERTIFHETKSRAKASKIEFNLSIEDIVIPEVCPVLGTKFASGLGGRKDNSPSIDKIIPSKGYVKGNVKIISWLANCIKRDCTDPEVFEKIALYIRSNQSE